MDPNLIAKEKKIPWHLVGVFLLLSIGIIVVGYIYYDYEKSSVISDVKSDLAAFAELKVKQINSWRRARTSSASSLPDNRYFIQDVNNFLGQSSNANKSKLVQWLLPVKNGLNFKNIFLFDQNGKELLKIGNQAEPMNQFDKSFITNALRKKQVSFSNFHFNFDSTDIHIDLIATIGKVDRENKEIVGAILFRIDPRTDLYPLIQLWPKQSKSAEMLLVSKDGDSVRFLNDLRFVKNAPVRLAFSSGDSILPAALAVRGITGIVKGRDYRNVDVYASLNKIQDSPWFLVSKIDKSEIEEPLRERMISLVVIVLLLVIVTGSVIILFWYRQRSHYIHQRLIEEIERKAILAHFDQLVKYSNDIYLLLDPNFSIIEANNKVLSEYGYTRDEIRQLLISDLTPADKKDFIINKLSLLQNDDNIVFEVLQERKDGYKFYVEISARLLTIENTNYYQCIGRDITDRKTAEKNIKESEERYRNIFMDNPNPMWVYDIETLRFLDVNNRAIIQYGYTREEFLSITIADIRPIEDVPRLIENISSIENGYDDAGVWCHRKKDGTLIFVEITSHVIIHEGRRAEIVLAHDVTERIKMEEMVRSTQQRQRELTTIVNSSPVIAFLWAASPGWPVIFVSENIIQFGYKVNDFIDGKISYEQLIHPDDWGRVVENTLKLTQQSNDEYNQIYRIVTASGMIRYVDDRTVVRRDATGTPTHYQGILLDITDRIEAEEWAEQVLDNTSEAVFFVDVLKDGTFKYNRLNRINELSTGLRTEDVHGKTPQECLPAEIADRVTKNYQRCLHEGKSISYEEDLNLPAGRKIWNTILVPLRDSSGRIYRIAGFGRNITELKSTEEILKQQSAAMNAAIDGMAILDKEGNYIYVNNAHASIYGYDQGVELVGKRWHILYDDNELHRFQQDIMPSMAKQGHWHGEAIGKKKDGALFQQDVSLTGLSGGGLICVVRDISARVAAESNLRKSEERFSKSFNASPYGLTISRLDDGQYIDVNESFLRLVGMERDQVIGRSSSDLKIWINSEDRKSIMDQLCDQGYLRNILTDFVNEFGEIRTWSSSLEIIEVENIKCVLSIIDDITERKHTEKLLQNEYDKFKMLLEHFPLGVMLIKSDRSISFLNSKFVELFGYEIEEIPTMDDWRLKAYPNPDYRRYVKEKWESNSVSYVENIPIQEVLEVTPKNGTKKLVKFSATILPDSSTILTLDDITERKEAENKLQQSMQQRELVLQSVPIIFYTADVSENVNTTWISAQAKSITGFDTFQFLKNDRFWESRLHPEDKERVLIEYYSVLTKGKSNSEYRWRCADGNYKWFSDQINIFYDQNNRPQEVIGIWLDITNRKESDAAIERSESRYRALVESSRDLIFQLTTEGKFLFVNTIGSSAFNLNRDRIEEYHINDVFTPEVARFQMDTLLRVRETGKALYIEHPFTVKGEKKYYSTILVPILNSAREVETIIEIGRDITERKQSEEALRESEVRYRTLIETSHDGISLMDKSGQILFANQRKAQMLGREKVEDIIGTSAFDMFVPEQVERAIAVQKHLINVGFISDVEFILRRRDGTTFVAEFTASVVRDGSGNVVGIMDVVRDITERKRSEEQLRKLSRAIDQSPSAIIITDINGKIEYVNPQFVQMTGYSFKEAIGKNPRLLKSGEKSKEEYKELWNTVLSGKEWRGEFHNKKKSGDLYWESAVISPITNTNGKITHFVAVKEDVTERKSLESQLLRAQRMESLGTLAGGIAHDLNNVLSPIMLSIDLLKDRSTDDRSIRLLNTIESSVTRGKEIIKQVLTFARGLEGKKITIQITHILKEILHMLNETFQKSISISLDIREELWFVSGNITQIHQVLLNLCVNARDAMPQGGRLNLSAANLIIDENNAGLNIDAKPGSYIVIGVRDTGVGIPEHLKDKIFEPFFTTKEIGKGTGLGLSTAHSIIKTHGGFITVESVVAKGTNFNVYLPAVQNTEIEKTEQAAYRLPAGNGELILVIEDEISILDITQQTLEYYNYRVATAHDGTEAISQFAAIGNEVKIVLTDIMMPVLDGIATARTLRKLRPDVKIIMTSGMRTIDQQTELSDIHVQAFLQKPYTAEKLLSTIYEVLRMP
jgi:PAS domain S-box-containing protein